MISKAEASYIRTLLEVAGHRTKPVVLGNDTCLGIECDSPLQTGIQIALTLSSYVKNIDPTYALDSAVQWTDLLAFPNIPHC